MYDRPVLVIPIQADPVSLHQTLSVLDSHQIRHDVRSPTTAVAAAVATDHPLLVLVQGGGAGILMVQTVEKISTATGCRVPILVLAEHMSDTDEERLFSSGARDVLGIPVLPTRLRVRILAMRRAAIGNAHIARKYVCGALVIDTGRREASINREEIPLTRSEFDLLALLAREPRRVVTREELATCIRQPGNGKAVESHLSRLRKKVSGVHGSRVIEPVRGVGYRLGELQSAQRVG